MKNKYEILKSENERLIFMLDSIELTSFAKESEIEENIIEICKCIQNFEMLMMENSDFDNFRKRAFYIKNKDPILDTKF